LGSIVESVGLATSVGFDVGPSVARRLPRVLIDEYMNIAEF